MKNPNLVDVVFNFPFFYIQYVPNRSICVQKTNRVEYKNIVLRMSYWCMNTILLNVKKEEKKQTLYSMYVYEF